MGSAGFASSTVPLSSEIVAFGTAYVYVYVSRWHFGKIETFLIDYGSYRGSYSQILLRAPKLLAR